MTVAYTYNSVSKEDYERMFPHVLGNGADHEGLIVHAAGKETDGTWRIIEVWDSDDSRSRWEHDTLFPVLEKNGVDTSQGPPEWTRVEVEHIVAR